MRTILTSAIIFLIIIDAISQTPYPFEILQKNTYSEAYFKLDSLKEQYIGHKYENYYYQAMGTLYSFLGKYDKAINCFLHRDSIFNRLADTTISMDIKKVGVSINTLDSLYKTNNVVLINEAHHVSKHRAFLYNQLHILKSLNYKYLAIEALNSGLWEDSLLLQRAYPIYTKTGIYINDPIFANIIRRAIKLGFKLIPYESYEKNREQKQAINIAKQYDKSKGKLIVYAGYAHICKSENDKLMAYYLQNILQEKILSISQNLPKSYLYKNFQSDKYYLIRNNDDCFDYYLFSSYSETGSNIPKWYDLLGNYSYEKLSKFYSKNIKLPALIQLLYPNEENAIPVYQYLIEKSENYKIDLPLIKKTKYKLVIQNNEYKDSVFINYF